MPRRGGSDNGSENQELAGTFETLRDEGEHFVHVKLWQKAIDSFTRVYFYLLFLSNASDFPNTNLLKIS